MYALVAFKSIANYPVDVSARIVPGHLPANLSPNAKYGTGFSTALPQRPAPVSIPVRLFRFLALGLTPHIL